jgi:hypothetical protein
MSSRSIKQRFLCTPLYSEVNAMITVLQALLCDKDQCAKLSEWLVKYKSTYCEKILCLDRSYDDT